MKLRIMSLLTLLVFVLSISVLAVSSKKATVKNVNQPKQVRADKNINRQNQAKVIKELGLTDAQQKKIREIAEKYRADVRKIAQSTATQEEKKTNIASLRNTAAAAVEAVLTPQQREQAKQNRLINRLLNPMNQMNAGAIRTFAQIDLTEAQKTRIKSVQDAMRVKLQAIKSNTSLTDAQKKARIAEVRKQTNQEIMNILTPVQKQKLQELKTKKQQPKQRPAK